MSDELIVAVIVAVRLGVPLLIPLFPLPAILVCLVVDAGDQTNATSAVVGKEGRVAH